MVQNSKQAQGQGRQNGRRELKNRNYRKTGARKNAGRLDKTKLIGNRQTENTGINALGIMVKMGDTFRGVETSTKTGETDQSCDRSKFVYTVYYIM